MDFAPDITGSSPCASTISAIRSVDVLSVPNYADRGRYLYIISEGDQPICKIGVARNAKWRLIDLQVGNPRKLELRLCWYGAAGQMRFLERAIHQSISATQKIRGEWVSLHWLAVAEIALAHIADLESIR